MKPIFLLLALTLALSTRSFGQNHAPVAVNDTIYGYYNYPIRFNLLKNDYDPDGDAFYVSYLPGNTTKINDSTWEFNDQHPALDYTTSLVSSYYIKDTHGAIGIGKLVFVLKAPLRYDSININNLNALISPIGQHFWNFENAHFEAPKGSGKTAVFNHSVWIGGLDSLNQLCFAGGKYAQGPNNAAAGTCTDFTQGPITTSAKDSNYYEKWNRVWKITKQQIQTHISSWNNPGYQPIDVIKNWPANGDVAKGQSAQIAPFYDLNGNGIYEPLQGDYPLIRGDEAVFFVSNDHDYIHTETKGEPVGVEVHGMAYEFDKPNDSILNNALFFHYDIVNRSQKKYHDAYLGLWCDFDLGWSGDDFMGTDVAHGMLYCYNDTAYDGKGHPEGYGAHPPSIGMKVIGGPLLPSDGIDNPSGGCDYSINGLGFGDNIVDNERLGMTNSMIRMTDYNFAGPNNFMSIASEYYGIEKSVWLDNVHATFGSFGHPISGDTAPECHFMFPGKSDILCNWGTEGKAPGYGYNQNGKYWTDYLFNGQHGNRSGAASIGPFTMSAGETIPLDYCFLFAPGKNGDNLTSLNDLINMADLITPRQSTLITIPTTYFSVNEIPAPTKLGIRPNPARDFILVTLDEKKAQPYQIFDYSGKLLSEGSLKPGTNTIPVNRLDAGVYLLKSGSQVGRFIKM